MMIDNYDKSILIIEDDIDTLECLLTFLKTKFIWKQVYLAKDGNEAKHLLKTREIDIVLSDYRIPQYNGIEILEMLHKKRANIPKYIFISGFASQSMADKAKSLGACGILQKPIDQETLEDLMKLISDP